MIKLKGSERSDHAQSAMSKAVGGYVKKELNPNWNLASNEYEQVSIKAGASANARENEELSEVHDIMKKDVLATGELKSNQNADNSEDSEDLFGDDDDEGDSVVKQILAARYAHIQKQSAVVNKYKALGHGSYSHVAEDQFLPAVTGSKYVICHFFHNDFERCKIIDKHLTELAPKYLPVRFIFIDAEKAPFFVSKLKVQVLPTIVLFRDGIAFDRIVGFEELGGEDDFPVSNLVNRLKKAKILRSIRKSDGEEVSGDEDDANRSTNFRKSNRGAVQETEFSDDE